MLNKSAFSYGKIFYLTSLYTFCFFVFIWFILRFFKIFLPESYYELFSDSYGIVAFFGALSGLYIFGLWGGFKSSVGRSLILFSTGLVFQFFGQVTYAYYRRILGIEVPYPSFGEIFYFGSIPIYILAVWELLQSSTNKSTLKRTSNKIYVFFVPFIMLFIAYEVFLQDYDFSEVPLLTVFLDFGYPILQAIQISLAFLTFLLSRSFLGGELRKPVLLLVFALLIQYVADIYYTFKVINEAFESGGISDLLYLISYFSMTAALYSFLPAYKKIKALTGN